MMEERKRLRRMNEGKSVKLKSMIKLQKVREDIEGRKK